MNILYIDTTTDDLVVAVIKNNEVLNFSSLNCGLRHSETLCNRVAEAMASSGLSWTDLDAYSCAIGPGSFTGIRIGISTLKGYCVAVEKPIIAVNCLQAIAISKHCGAKMKAKIDAGNGYYFADYANGIAPCLVAYDDEKAADAGSAASGAEYLDGAVKIVRKAFVENNFAENLSPMYIRRSQAEERR